MGFGRRSRLVRSPRRPAQKPLADTRKFFSQLAGLPKDLGLSRKPVAGPKPLAKAVPPGQGKAPLGKPVALGKPVELVPADELGQEMNENLKAGDRVLVRGKPATVAGHSRRGGLLVTPGPTPAPARLEETGNRPKGEGPDHGPADDSDVEDEDA